MTGQDATPQGVQYILAGWQSGTVCKNIRTEANAAAKVAVQIIKGKQVTHTHTPTRRAADGAVDPPAPPTWITKANYRQLFTAGA